MNETRKRSGDGDTVDSGGGGGLVERYFDYSSSSDSYSTNANSGYKTVAYNQQSAFNPPLLFPRSSISNQQQHHDHGLQHQQQQQQQQQYQQQHATTHANSSSSSFSSFRLNNSTHCSPDPHGNLRVSNNYITASSNDNDNSDPSLSRCSDNTSVSQNVDRPNYQQYRVNYKLQLPLLGEDFQTQAASDSYEINSDHVRGSVQHIGDSIDTSNFINNGGACPPNSSISTPQASSHILSPQSQFVTLQIPNLSYSQMQASQHQQHPQHLQQRSIWNRGEFASPSIQQQQTARTHNFDDQNTELTHSSGYFSKLESPASPNGGGIPQNSFGDSSTSAGGINFWARPATTINTGTNTNDSSSNGSCTLDLSASGNAFGEVPDGCDSMHREMTSGTSFNNNIPETSNEFNPSDNNQYCKQTMENAILINSLIEDIEQDLHKILNDCKPLCIHVDELATRLSDVTGAQGGSMKRKSDLKSTPSISRSASEMPMRSVPFNDYVPFDFQLLDAAEKIKELNNLVKNVNLTEAISSRIANINNRWRDIRSEMQGYLIRERDLDLGYTMTAPWKRKVTTNGVPYFLNTSNNTTQWDHPLLKLHMENLEERTCEVQLSAYKIALKCRATQKFLILSHLKAEDILQICMNYANTSVITIRELEKLLKNIYGEFVKASKRPLVADLAMNWIIKMYDPRRSGSLRFDSLLTALILMSSSAPAEKFYYLFKLVADENMEINHQRLSILIYDIIQVPLSFIQKPSTLGSSSKESTMIGNSRLSEKLNSSAFNVEGAVQSCLSFKPEATPEELCRGQISIDLTTWMSWVNEEPQCLVWSSLTHRLILSEETVHKYRCSICSCNPIKGFRYRCLKCFNFNICQNCFFMGLNYQFHKPCHPIQEYCTSQTSGESVRVLFSVLKNRIISSKKQLAYLPTSSSISQRDPRHPYLGIHEKGSRDDSSINSEQDGTLPRKHSQSGAACWSKAFRPIRAKSVDDLDQSHQIGARNSANYTADSRPMYNSASPNSILSQKDTSSKSSSASPQMSQANTLTLRRPITKQASQFGKNGRGVGNGYQSSNTHHVSFHLLNRSDESEDEMESVHVGVPRHTSLSTPSTYKTTSTFRSNGKL